MNLTFTRSFIGIFVLIILLWLSYYVYRKALATQVLKSLRHEPSYDRISLSSYLFMCFAIFLVGVVLLVYADASISARDFSAICAIKPSSEPVDPYAKCPNGFGKDIYVDSRLALNEYNNDLTLRNFASDDWYEIRNSDIFNTLRNQTMFHNKVIQTRDYYFVIDNRIRVEILETSVHGILQVQFTNIGETPYEITTYYPLNLWLEHEMITGEGFSKTLAVNETHTQSYYYDHTVSGQRLRLHADNFTFERGTLR